MRTQMFWTYLPGEIKVFALAATYSVLDWSCNVYEVYTALDCASFVSGPTLHHRVNWHAEPSIISESCPEPSHINRSKSAKGNSNKNGGQKDKKCST